MSDAGVSVPTLLGRRAAAIGVVSFVCLIGGASAGLVQAVRSGLAIFGLGVVLGLWAVSYLARAFWLRRTLVVERHLRELTEILGELPSPDVLSRETNCGTRRAQCLLELSARATLTRER